MSIDAIQHHQLHPIPTPKRGHPAKDRADHNTRKARGARQTPEVDTLW